MRAVLLASATATSRAGFFTRSALIQAVRADALVRAKRMTAVAPTNSKLRRWRSPIFEMPPRRVLLPDEFWRGTRPSQAANSRPDLKCDGSVTVAAIAVAVMKPTPGD